MSNDSRVGHQYLRRCDKNKQNYVYYHREIMESFIGRELSSSEEVHHINGNKQDNRLENLQVLPINKHAKITFDMAKNSKKVC